MRTLASERCTVSRKLISKSLWVPDVRWRLSTQMTWVILFTTRLYFFTVFDADVAATSQRGVHMLVVLVRRDIVQQTLQERAHPLCGAQILDQAVLVHFVGIRSFQVHEQKPKLALADVLKKLFDLFWCKTAADLF